MRYEIDKLLLYPESHLPMVEKRKEHSGFCYMNLNPHLDQQGMVQAQVIMLRIILLQKARQRIEGEHVQERTEQFLSWQVWTA